MNLVFGSSYAVVVTARPIIREGNVRKCWCDCERKRILIADNATPRGQLLRHEAWHAWAHEHRVPEQADQEELAHQVAAFSQAFDSQFQAQGGETALNGMMPSDREVLDAKKTRAGIAARALEWRCCGNCNAPVAPGSIETADPKWNVPYGTFVVDRSMLCEVCDARTHWTEKATAEGIPTGEICEMPRPRVTNVRRMAV